MGSIQLYSGRLFDPLWPTPDSFTIEDIAHGLSEIPRFAGHTKKDYVVAQHCIIGASWFRQRGLLLEARHYLFHESEEGLGLGDMPTPIKYLPEMSAYRAIGENVRYAACRKVGLLEQAPPIVKELDTRMACAEAKVLCHTIPAWAKDVDTSDLIIKPYKKRSDAKKYFIKEYQILFPNGINITE
jgi:hypothetical protein